MVTSGSSSFTKQETSSRTLESDVYLIYYSYACQERETYLQAHFDPRRIARHLEQKHFMKNLGFNFLFEEMSSQMT